MRLSIAIHRRRCFRGCARVGGAQARAAGKCRVDRPIPVALDPHAAELYRRRVADLGATLAALSPGTRDEAHTAIRELVEKIVIQPRERQQAPEIYVLGQRAALLRASKGPE